MKSKILFPIILAAAVAVTGCSQYYTIFAKKSVFFTAGEREMLEKSLKAIDMGTGYDSEYNLDYIYVYSHTSSDIKVISDKFSASIRQYRSADIVSFYEKIFMLYALTAVKINEAEKRADWRTNTYLKKYLSPGLETYLALIESETLRRDISYSSRIEIRKKEIYDSVLEELLAERRRREADFD